MAILSSLRPSARTAIFADKTEQAIATLLRQAKALQTSAYRERQGILWDFFSGAHAAHMVAHLRVSHPNISQQWCQEVGGLPHMLRILGVTEMMTRDLACIYGHQEPETYLTRGGDRLPESDPEMLQWRRDSRGIGRSLRNLDLWTVLFRCSFIHPQWIRPKHGKGRVAWTIIPPHRVGIRQSEADPSELLSDAAVTVELPQPVDTVGAATAALYETWADGRMMVHDGGGRLQGNPLFPDHINGYLTPEGDPVLPFVLVRELDPLPGEFWPADRQDWAALQRWVNLHLTEEAFSLRHGAWGTPVLRSDNDELGIKPYSPNTPVQVDSTGDFKYAQSGTDFGALREGLDAGLRRAARAEGMPADTWSTDGATRNLNAKMVEYHHLDLRRKERIPMYREAVREAWEITKVIGNYHRAEDPSRVQYSPDTELVVVPAPLRLPIDPMTAATARGLEIQQGLASAVDDLMHRDGLTRAQAELAVARNLAEAQSRGAGWSDVAPATGMADRGRKTTPPNLERSGGMP